MFSVLFWCIPFPCLKIFIELDADKRYSNRYTASSTRSLCLRRFWEKFQALAEERERMLAAEQGKANPDSGPEQERTVSEESQAKSPSPG